MAQYSCVKPSKRNYLKWSVAMIVVLCICISTECHQDVGEMVVSLFL